MYFDTGGSAVEFSFDNFTISSSQAPSLNNAPELGGTPADDSATEDVATTIDLSAYNVSDDDGDTITLTLAVDRGSIAATDGNGTTAGVTVATSGTASMTLQGSAADLNTYLNDTSKLEYTTAANDTTAATLTVTPNDGTTNGTADTVTINITPVNDNPTVAGAPSDVTVTEDTQSNVDLSALSFADVDGDNLTVTLTASAGTFATPVDGSGVGAGVTATQVNATTITLSGAAADISTYLDTASNIQYTPSPNVSGQDQATITISASDGNGGNLAANPSINLDVTQVNDAPVFTGLDGTPSYTEGGAVVQLDADATISDLELDALNGGNGDYSGASLTLARNGGADTSDLFNLASGGNLTVTGGPAGGGTITAAGNVIATIANTGPGQLQLSFADNGTVPTTALVDEMLQAIRYSNGSDDPGASVQLDYTFSDGGASDSGSVTVAVTEVNDAPTLIATGQDPGYIEEAAASDLFSGVTASTMESGQTLTGLTLTVTNVSDGANEILGIDGSDLALTDGNSITSATSGLTINCSVSGSTATVSFSGAALSEAALQTLVDGLSYLNGSDTPTTGNNRVVTITALTDSGANGGSDDNGAALSLSSTVSLTAVNDAPVVANAFTETSQIVAGSGVQNVDLFDDATVSNADSADYNGGFLTLAQTAGTTNGSWSLDGTNATSGGDAAVSAGETVQVGGSSIGTVDVTDDGQGGNTLTINFSAADATSANLQTLLQNLNYSAPSGVGDRTFEVTLSDADGTANGGDQDVVGNVTLSVTPNPPVIGSLEGDSSAATEEGGAVALDIGGNATVTDADSANFDGGSVTVSVIANADASSDQLSVDTSGTIRLAGTTAGSNVAVSDTVIGTLGNDIAAGNDFVVNLNAEATPTRVQVLLQALTFEATGDNPTESTRTLGIAVSDGIASDTVSVSIAVSAQNDAPQLVGLPTDLSFTEDTQANLDLSAATLSDVDTTGSVTLTLAASAGTLSANSAGGLTADGSGTASLTLTGSIADLDTFLDGANITHTPAADLSGNDAGTIGVSVNDGGTDTSLGSINIDITAVNDAPVIATNAGPSVQAGRTVTLTSAHLDEGDLDDEGAGLTYTLDSLPAEGELQLSGTPLAVNDTFTQQDIDDGKVSFTAGSTTGNVSFDITLADGGEDGAGTVSDTVTLSVTAPPPSSGDGSSSSDTTDTIDGVEVTTTTDSDGTVTTTIPVVTEDRDEDPGTTTGDADIPLINGDTNNNGNVVTATLPVGVGLSASGQATAQTATEALASLVRAIDERDSAEESSLIGGAQSFLTNLAATTTLDVRTIIPTTTSTSLSSPIVITGSASSKETTQSEAFVIDTRSLPKASALQLDNIEFVSIVGSAVVSGGAGRNYVVADDQSQTIVLGEDDDELHGGGGDDIVGSKSGDDLLFGGSGNDTVSGGADNDRLVGGSGNDTLLGGSGVDVARFNVAAAEVVILQDDDGRLVVEAGEWGSDTLSEVELLRFDDQVVLVDTLDSLSVRGFDEAGYLARNPDVAEAVARGDFAKGLAHYQEFGASEGRGADGLAGFDEAFYLALNPDVAAVVARGDFASGFAHYRQYGEAEGRDPNVLFDEAWYREHNTDVDQAVERGEFDSAYQHFLAFGGNEQRDASAWADMSDYLSRNPDVAAADINPLVHYLQYGLQEGRMMTAADEGLW